MRIPMIAGNWKMNTTLAEAVTLVKDLDQGIPRLTPLDVVVCPPFISLAAVNKALSGSQIRLGAQNLFYEEKGAFTGEISPLMLSGLCRYVILGHSERRQYFNETDDVISRKIKAALKFGLDPVLCVGENLVQYEAGQTEEVVSRQIKGSLAGLESISHLTVAYEPIWAIGTGRAASGRQANQTIGLIRSVLAEQFSNSAAQNTRLLYGGSVTPDNIAEFISQSEIDGALVGGASLKAPAFLSIIDITVKTCRLI